MMGDLKSNRCVIRRQGYVLYAVVVNGWREVPAVASVH